MISESYSMCLVVDQGNSFTKIARFEGDGIADLKIVGNTPSEEAIQSVQHMFGQAGIPNNLPAIFSSVAAESMTMIRFLEQHFRLVVMSPEVKLPVHNLYETPDTLGNDRMAASVGALVRYPETPLLTIDAGTCITYDFTTENGEYLGGGISPGLGMRLKALHTFTGKLPLISMEDEVALIGKTTKESILSGVVNGMLAEIDGIINQYRHQYPRLKVILTGGDAIYFDKKLKNNIFAVPNLVLLGLKDILLYNVEN